MPGGNKNINGSDNTNGFQNNPQNINKKGRPPKIYNHIKNLGYSKDDILAVFGELPFYTISQLQKIIKKKKTPAIVIVVAMALKNAISTNDYRHIKEIIEHTIGKPNQKIEQTIESEQTVNIIVDTPEQAQKIDNLINKINETD